MEKFELQVRSSNAREIKLYQSMDFAEEGRKTKRLKYGSLRQFAWRDFLHEMSGTRFPLWGRRALNCGYKSVQDFDSHRRFSSKGPSAIIICIQAAYDGHEL